MKTPKEIASEAMAYVAEHEHEQDSSYWVGYLLGTLKIVVAYSEDFTS